MAGIDHTVICFHNGRLMRSLIEEKGVGDAWVSLVPFEYSRDAEPRNIAFNERNEVSVVYSHNRLVQWIAEKFCDFLPREYVSYYCKDDVEIIAYEEGSYNVIFYAAGTESYVMLGGYGHFNNPYTHFYRRGYGEEFERRMAKECYEWLFEHVLSFALGWIHAFDQENGREVYQRLCQKLHFKEFWSMDAEEQEQYEKNPFIELDN